MNFELNFNEWHQEDVWKPCIRTGAAVLSSVLILASVQGTEPVCRNDTMLPRTDYRVSVLNADIMGNDFLKKAAKTALEAKAEESVTLLPVEETVEPAAVEQTKGTTNMIEISEDTGNAGIGLETAARVAENTGSTESAAPAMAIVPDQSENVKAEENIQEVVPVERKYETISEEDKISGDEQMAAEVTDTGYLINDEGMIYGVSGSCEMVEDGVLVLPAEGCSGIAAGALGTLRDTVEEIEIPANITEIQPGAFSGLSELGWIEAEETNSSYSSMDGVLYTADGTGLVAFPSAWTGTFQVPDGVRYFAEKAFEGTNLDCIDARACALEQTGELSETVELLR